MTPVKPLPRHTTRCTHCGYVVSLECQQGQIREWCYGCERNRARAGMRLPPLDFRPQATYVAEDRQYKNALRLPPAVKRRPAPRGTGNTRVLAKLPISERTACHATEIAASLGVRRQAAEASLHILLAHGLAFQTEGPHPRQKQRITTLWYKKRAA